MVEESASEDGQSNHESDGGGTGTLEPETHKIEHNWESKKWLCRKDCLRKTAIITFLWIAYFLCNIAFSVIDPFFPLEGEAKGVSPAVIGAIIGSSPLCVSVFSPLIGYLLPCTGFALPIFLGLFIVGASYILLGFASLLPSWGFILFSLILRVAEGIGTALFFTSTFAISPIIFPNHVGKVLAFLELSAETGIAIGFVLGGTLYEAGGFKLPFFVVGSAVLLLILPCELLVRKIKMRECCDKHKNLRSIVILCICTDLVAIALIVSMVCLCIMSTFHTPILQPFLVKQFEFNSITVAAVFLTTPASTILLNIVVGIIVDKFGYNRYFILSALALGSLSATVMGILYILETRCSCVVIIYSALAGAAIALGDVPTFGDFLQTAERYLSKGDSKEALVSFISGLLTSALFFGEFLGPVLGGGLNTYISFPACAIVLGEILLSGALLLLGVTIFEKFTTRVADGRLNED